MGTLMRSCAVSEFTCVRERDLAYQALFIAAMGFADRHCLHETRINLFKNLKGLKK